MQASWPSAGADMRTLFAPALMCLIAPSLFVNAPVHSTTKSIFSFPQGSFSGSSSWNTGIFLFPTIKKSLSTLALLRVG